MITCRSTLTIPVSNMSAACHYPPTSSGACFHDNINLSKHQHVCIADWFRHFPEAGERVQYNFKKTDGFDKSLDTAAASTGSFLLCKVKVCSEGIPTNLAHTSWQFDQSSLLLKNFWPILSAPEGLLTNPIDSWKNSDQSCLLPQKV